MARKKRKLSQPDVDLDLTPMIDVIFLLIIFFILAGRITAEISNAEITVPPTMTSKEIDTPDDWQRFRIEVWGTTSESASVSNPRHKIKFGLRPAWIAEGVDDLSAYQGLRQALDEVYVKAKGYYTDEASGMKIPKVILEIRSDADTQYRIIQEIQQVATDTVNPDDGMKPMVFENPVAEAKAFVHFHFTTRLPEDG